MKEEFAEQFNVEKGAELLELVGTPAFPRSLLDEAANLSGVEELFGYLVRDGDAPTTIISASKTTRSETRVAQYVNRYFRHDPAVHAIRETEPGNSVILRIPHSQILASDYKRQCFAEPGFAEKLSFGWRGDGYMVVLSFYCTDIADTAALAKLSSLVALVMPILVRHHSPIDRQNAIEVIERRIRRSFPDLSRRETQVCARTMLGWPAQKTAEQLGIGAGSVMTYRNRAYSKLGYSNAAEFLPHLLH